MLTSVLEVFFIFLRLGLTSFGGPVAHLGYFHHEFVEKRKWFAEDTFLDIVALCQFLPGPASSQVGIAIGLTRAGVLGAVAAWVGFTLPSALLLIGFAMGLASLDATSPTGWLHGLKVAAVAIVAQAIWGMGIKLCADPKRATIAVLGLVIAILFANPLGQLSVIALGAMLGWRFLKDGIATPRTSLTLSLSTKTSFIYILLLFSLLLVLPLLSAHTSSQGLKVFDSFFRSGALVFGGGHVVLPLLKAEVVNSGWVSQDQFLAGYGAAQAVPGPLFAFSAYLGAVSRTPPSGILGAMICLLGAFLPSFLLVFGALPYWARLRHNRPMRNALSGVNAAVVGLLMAAFYNPVWTSSILAPKDFAFAVTCLLLLLFWKWPSWAVVILSALFGALTY